MSYFSDHYGDVRLPVCTDENLQGLRNAQLGAIHAIAAHFTLSDEPALAVMPTGSGKTAVLMLTAFLQRVERVLVITPSKLVRDQIAEEFASLDTLRVIGAVPNDIALPSVHKVTSLRKTPALWEELREHAVAVSTPNAVSPGARAVVAPPDDLFDLVLIDEAHHSAANTWMQLVQSFPTAHKVLFTATPFRRDKQKVLGRIVYSYPVSRAVEDKIFGDISFVPVAPQAGEPPDVAIAKQAAKTLQEDRNAGLRHCLMVRTDRRSRADELASIYEQHTDLSLAVVHSGYSYRFIKNRIKKLRDGSLDGIICVSMLGEGFDLPELKIAAIHAPHRSLEVTLQFIGRFARTNAEDIGEAKFIAIPNEIRHETEQLYREGSMWRDIVANLSETRIETEQKVREELESFDEPTVTSEDTQDLSLYVLRPATHVKIFEVNNVVDIFQSLSFPKQFVVEYHAVSDDLTAAVYITKESEQPKWTSLGKFEKSEYDLFVLYYHLNAGLLFINASRRSISLYDRLAEQLTGGDHRVLPLYKVARVIRGITDIECFNIGMRKRVRGGGESYRILTGPKTQNVVGASDGRLFHQGHIYARGDLGDRKVTIGYSSGSKVWSNRNLQIPQLIDWCVELGDNIASSATVKTGSKLDVLSHGEQLKQIPDHVTAADWPPEAYQHHFNIRYRDSNGHEQTVSFLDGEFEVDRNTSDTNQVRLSLMLPGLRWEICFSIQGQLLFSDGGTNQGEILLDAGREEVELLTYLNHHPLSFYTSDFSRFEGVELFRANHDIDPYSRDSVVAIDWNAASVNIECEVEGAEDGKLSIHTYFENHLVPQNDVVFYDHRTGEVADFITFHDSNERLTISFYHCKGAGGSQPGNRVGDVYEVTGQVIRSIRWVEKPHDLLTKIRGRTLSGSRFAKGDANIIEQLLKAAQAKTIYYRIGLVQPGISAAALDDNTLHVLAAADDYVRQTGSYEMVVFGSA